MNLDHAAMTRLGITSTVIENIGLELDNGNINRIILAKYEATEDMTKMLGLPRYVVMATTEIDGEVSLYHTWTLYKLRDAKWQYKTMYQAFKTLYEEGGYKLPTFH